MNRDWYKSKLVWLAVLQVLISVSEFLSGVKPGTAIITVITGIVTLILKFVSQKAAGAPAGDAKLNFFERIYFKIWFYTEGLWIKSEKLRRPFTYMMRDFILEHPAWTTVIILVTNGGLMALVWWNWIAGYFTVAFYWMLMGHLIWGTPMKKGEQEDPEYTGQ